MKKISILLVFLLVGCATTIYKSFEAKSNSFEGRGGTRTVVEGVDFWTNGDPPRKFKVVGIIEDERPTGLIPMSQLHGDIAKKAKENGGDALVELGSNSQITGIYSNTYMNATPFGATGTSMAIPVRHRSSKFAVIKYLD